MAMREDRVVLYGSVGNEVGSRVYAIRATSAGSFCGSATVRGKHAMTAVCWLGLLGGKIRVVKY